MAPSEDGRPSCARELDKRLSECGLSEDNITHGNARALGTARDKEGEAVETPLTEAGLTASYRFRSSRERNYAKKRIEHWFKDPSFVLASLIARYGDILTSPRRTRHALRSWFRMNLKWGTNDKLSGDRSRRQKERKHGKRAGKTKDDGIQSAIRMDVSRTRKAGRKLMAVLLRWARLPIPLIYRHWALHMIATYRGMLAAMKDPQSPKYEMAMAYGKQVLRASDPNREPAPEEVKALYEYLIEYGERGLEFLDLCSIHTRLTVEQVQRRKELVAELFSFLPQDSLARKTQTGV